MNDYRLAIEELHLDGVIGLGNCSKSTVYRWARIINDILKFEHADWRVKPNVKERALYVI